MGMAPVKLGSRICAFGFVALMTLGCAGGSDRPATVSVGGKVTYNGQPVEGAGIQFVIKEGSRSAFGTTNAAGEFTLTTFEPGDGAVPGDYTIIVTKLEGAGKQLEETSPDSAGAMTTEAEDAAEPKPLLPLKYASAAESPLKVTVPAGGLSGYNVELSD
jgi:hypothetical protein